MTNCSFDEIARVLLDAPSVLVASHLRPDGDALGSTLGLALWLRDRGVNVQAWNQDGTPGKFAFLPASEMLQAAPIEKPEFAVLVAVDTSVESRLGSVLEGLVRPEIVINIDHHISNEGFGDLNFIKPDAPATGEIIFDFLASQGATITPEIAANLFAAISTDTGSFQYENTTAHTFSVAAALVEAGIAVGDLSAAIYHHLPRRRFELLKEVLGAAKFSDDGKVASSHLQLATTIRLGTIAEDTEGLIDELRAIDSVVAAVFFEELSGGNVRVSARSKDRKVDVCQICALFGGGGHPLAAGARISGPLAEVETKFLEAVNDAIQRCD